MTGILTQLGDHLLADDAPAKRDRRSAAPGRLSLRAAFAVWFTASCLGWGLIFAVVWWLWW